MRVPDARPAAGMATHWTPVVGEPRGLQVLVHGATYDHRYWDVSFPGPDDYSYVHHMAARGYACLAVDLPGTGDSGRPDGDAVSLDAVARDLHEVVTAVRADLTADHGRDVPVALVGHSLGGVVSTVAQSRWHSADALVVLATGFNLGQAVSPNSSVVADALQSPYACLPIAERARFFFHAGQTDPRIIDYDNATLRVSLPRRLWLDCRAARGDAQVNGSRSVTCPVYVQLGEFDPIMPGRFAAVERECWPASTDCVVESLPRMGHCMNMHRNREASWTAIASFLDTVWR
ncbi:lysophospholipase [Nocardia sp. CA2R105]|uniref:alpha/beta hydrolase n=1 Tax=Nocardia coffeae TaxID=2873381 RepID=UPI001CA6510E|nr:alpha/beta fold hydrolase [Nocardia coffeae]MBY8858685.1 lysophospholipase [Nocardia coffeae]